MSKRVNLDWSAPRLERLRRFAAADVSIGDMAHQFHVCCKSLRKVLQHHGIPHRVGHRPSRSRIWTSAMAEEFARLSELETAPIDVAAALGISVRSVYTRLKETGPVRKSKPPKRPCLKCAKPFHSEGKGNRICQNCKSTREWCSRGYDDLSVAGQG